MGGGRGRDSRAKALLFTYIMMIVCYKAILETCSFLHFTKYKTTLKILLESINRKMDAKYKSGKNSIFIPVK